MLNDPRWLALERLALASSPATREASRGLCFHSTLELGRSAQRMGLGAQVAFLRWRVRDDPDFQEHWALDVGDDRVLDVTGAQVDGNPLPQRRSNAYPKNYIQARRYPIGLVLGVVDRGSAASGTHYSRRLVWNLHRCLFRHDTQDAWQRRDLRGLAEAAGALGRSAWTLLHDFLLERTLRRVERLLERLQ